MALVGVIALLVSLQALIEGERNVAGGVYTHYNNYIIFKSSFWHLLQWEDLYAAYPQLHFDYFKYSPSFAVLFSPFAVLPDYLGLSLWNLFNLGLLFFALYQLPQLNSKWVAIILLLSVFELITTTQNEQSNSMMLALFLLTFSSLEKRHMFLAALCIAIAIFTKLYAMVGLCLFLMYPDKGKQFVYVLVALAFIFLIPLILVDWNQLMFQYQSWFSLLGREHDQIFGISLMGVLHSWFGYSQHKAMPVFFGVGVFCLSFFQYKKWGSYQFRLLILCSVLIWVVIFNHRAESASYIIAYLGICLWFWLNPSGMWHRIWMLLAFILISLSPTDLFPRYLREHWVQPYALKAFPAIIVWLSIQYNLYKTKTDKTLKEVR